MTSVYLSYPSREWNQARLVIQHLIHLGFTVTHDWTQHFEDGLSESVDDARADIIGAASCEVLIAMTPINPWSKKHRELTTGQVVEIGAALGAGRRVFVIGEWNHFFAVLVEQLPTLAAALERIQ